MTVKTPTEGPEREAKLAARRARRAEHNRAVERLKEMIAIVSQPALLELEAAAAEAVARLTDAGSKSCAERLAAALAAIREPIKA